MSEFESESGSEIEIELQPRSVEYFKVERENGQFKLYHKINDKGFLRMRNEAFIAEIKPLFDRALASHLAIDDDLEIEEEMEALKKEMLELEQRKENRPPVKNVFFAESPSQPQPGSEVKVHPPKAKTAFQHYCAAICPTLNLPLETATIIAKNGWETENPEVKERYELLAEQDKQRYLREMKEIDKDYSGGPPVGPLELGLNAEAALRMEMEADAEAAADAFLESEDSRAESED